MDDPRIPACLISTILHTLLLLLLALLTYREGAGIDRVSVPEARGPTTVLSLQAMEPLDEPALTGRHRSGSSDQSRGCGCPASPDRQSLFDLQRQADPFEQPILDTVLLGSPSAVRLPGSGGLERRTPEGRREFGKLYGATEQSEQAVELALAYLAAHQRDNGSWSFDLSLDPCNGQCRHSKKSDSDTPTPSTGATGSACWPSWVRATHIIARDPIRKPCGEVFTIARRRGGDANWLRLAAGKHVRARDRPDGTGRSSIDDQRG